MRLLATPVRTILLLSGVVALAWAVTVERMRRHGRRSRHRPGRAWLVPRRLGDDDRCDDAAVGGPGSRPGRTAPTRAADGALLAGYLAVWTAYGLVAYALFRFVTSFDTAWLAWEDGGPYVAGGVIVAAGIYELTPLKQACLRRCRRPHPDEPALRSGLANGLYCVGASGGLMAVLFALGRDERLLDGVVAAVIFAEKVLPQGLRLTRPVAIALLALGISVAFSPANVPGLTEPGMSPSMEMER